MPLTVNTQLLAAGVRLLKIYLRRGIMKRNNGYYFFMTITYLCLLLLFVCSNNQAEAAEKETPVLPEILPSQIIFVAGEGVTAKLSMYTQQPNGCWIKNLAAEGFIGRNGLGKTKEGDGKTPTGIFPLQQAFGIERNPGTIKNYTRVNRHHYWVDDLNSQYYNQLVRDDHVKKDWKSAEHLANYKIQYAFSLVIGYNAECVKGVGSGIFLHCSANKPTAGCVAVPQNTMISILKELKQDCIISIGSPKQIAAQIDVLPLDK